jgi:type I restriction enzyme S subunit
MSLRFWERDVTLSDYVELNPRVNLPKGINVPFISMDVISPGTRKVYPVQERAAGGSGSKFGPGDTLFARITPCLENGKIAQYAGDRPGMGSTELFVLRARVGISDPSFVYYFSQQQDLRFSAEKSMSGASGRQRAVISSLSEFECKFPPLPIQQRIAGILSAYDELIENNQRRIKILEAMARGLYREWFVHFRFPGHENHPRVASTLGEIPQGWEAKMVSDILTRRTAGVVYRDADAKPEGIFPVIDQSTNEFLGFHDNEPDHLASVENPLAIFGDHTCKMQLVIEPFSIGPNVVPFAASRQLPTAFVFYAVNSLVQTQEYKRHWSPLNSKEIVVANNALAQKFADLIKPMLVQQATLRKSIRNLRRTRDLLLPRLLSGQINVEAQ